MTITLPELPHLGGLALLYMLSILSLLVCWLASHHIQRLSDRVDPNRRHSDDKPRGALITFWTFIAILSGAKSIVLFLIATAMLVGRAGMGSL